MKEKKPSIQKTKIDSLEKLCNWDFNQVYEQFDESPEKVRQNYDVEMTITEEKGYIQGYFRLISTNENTSTEKLQVEDTDAFIQDFFRLKMQDKLF